MLFYQVIETCRGEEFRMHQLDVSLKHSGNHRHFNIKIIVLSLCFFSPILLFPSITLSSSVSSSSSAMLHLCTAATPLWPSARWSSPWSSSASSWWKWTSRSKLSTGSGVWVLYMSYHTVLQQAHTHTHTHVDAHMYIVAQYLIFCFSLLCRIFSVLVLEQFFTSSLLWSVWLEEPGTALVSQAGSVTLPWTEHRQCACFCMCLYVFTCVSLLVLTTSATYLLVSYIAGMKLKLRGIL